MKWSVSGINVKDKNFESYDNAIQYAKTICKVMLDLTTKEYALARKDMLIGVSSDGWYVHIISS